MMSHQTMAELLQSSLEVSSLTQDPSTYRGRRTSINLLQRASQTLSQFADHFLGIPQQLSEMEQQLEAMTPWMSGVFTYGQPSFADDPLEPLYLDDDGNLLSLGDVVPAPRLELGTP